MNIADYQPTTPLMTQYVQIKKQYPDVLVLFQVGDFYELFFEDAKTAAAFLGIALTKRGTHNGQPIPLCGVPVHARDFYVTKLIKGGFKVLICDQKEEAKAGKLVERAVSQVLTPGTLTESHLLNEKSPSYLGVLFPITNTYVLIFGELLTGQLYITQLQECKYSLLESELARFEPDELVFPDTKLGNEFAQEAKKLGYFVTSEPFHSLDTALTEQVRAWVVGQFGSEHGARFDKEEVIRNAFAVFYRYIARTNSAALLQFKQLIWYTQEEYLIIDAATQRNLELFKNSFDGTVKHSLLSVLDAAQTGMGSRTIKKWLSKPLVKREAIEARLEAVGYLVADMRLRVALIELLKEIGDLERGVGRIALGRAQIHDYLHLSRALKVLPTLKQLLSSAKPYLLALITSKLAEFNSLVELLERALNTDPAYDWIIRSGFNEQLDKLRHLVQNGTQAIADLERQEIQKTGIQSLKIRYNAVYGYSIEITKANYQLVPERYIRQQTLVGRERFTTPELKDLERMLQTATNEIGIVEKELFTQVKNEVETYLPQLQKSTQALAYLDALISFATVAYENNYVAPQFHAQETVAAQDIIITEGRHPVVEKAIDGRFVPNSTMLTAAEPLWIITGPNMGGKSTYLRQVAHICIMAQCGSFVPAKSAQLPILDRIFTRIGASDRVSQGKSTFLVEMEETAFICNQATARSLIILDEVGRGTSTFDGLAIAQAVVEYIYNTVKARCLFATHYHELTALEQRYPGIVSYHTACSKKADQLLFLHKILRGTAEGSFGIEVAKLAQLPKGVIARAEEILKQLEGKG